MTERIPALRGRKYMGHKLRHLAEWLTRPHQQIQDEELKENAQLLAAMLLTTVVVTSLIVLLVIYFDPGDLLDLRTVAGYGTIVAALLFFVVNRMGYTRWATGGFVAFLTLAFISTPYVGEFPEFLAFAAVPMLLAGMFYRFRGAAYWILLILVTVFALNSLIIDETIWDRRIFWYFLLFSGGLTLTFKSYLNRLENIRRKKLDEANAQLTATINALPDLLFEVDRYGRIINYHAPDDAKSYVPEAGFIGRTVSEVFPTNTARNLMDALQKAAETGKHLGTQFSLDLPTGEHWFEVSISTKGDTTSTHEDLHFVAVARDITERKQAEALQAEHERLEVALQQEKELAQMRSQLISTIAHEFRSPLTVISISGSMLVQYKDKLSPEQKDEKLDSIIEEVKRLDKMIDDVSMLSKTQRGFLQYQPQLTDIVSFCETVVDELKSLTQPSQHLTLHVKNDIRPAQLDQRLLRHALTNLISNAIKYSPNGGAVAVDLSATDNVIHLAVSDEGIGIPAGDMPHLFQPFYRASNVGYIQGTGLGLSILKAIVNLHGGDVVCESQQDIGTTFKITIPIREKL